MKMSIDHHHAFALLLLCMWVASASAEITSQFNPGYTSASNPPPLLSNCQSYIEMLDGSTGYVHWTAEQETPGCSVYRNWTLRVPPYHGVFLYVKHMHLTNNTLLRFSRLLSLDSGVNDELIYTWRTNDDIFRFKSIVGGMRLNVEAPNSLEHVGSSFNITFTVYNESTLPKELPRLDYRPMFNCSQIMLVPEAIACDGIVHCLEEEDEFGCDYRQQGCDDWIPYQDKCLKLRVFPPHGYFFPDYSVTEQCQFLSQAALATLPDEEGISLVADMVNKAGLSFALVDIHKVKPMSTKHGYLYRFIWQWGAKGSPIAYKETEQLKSGSKFDCVLIALFPSVHFLPFSCSIYEFSLHTVGYVCMKPNPEISRTEAKRSVGVHLPEARGSIHGLLTKPCEDGSQVQLFHQCAWQDHALSPAWSLNSFSLFQCGCGPPVHYTLLCDGVEDCVDGSDEKECPPPESVMKPDTAFICNNLQVLPQQYYECDGLPHCLDNSDEEDCIVCKGVKCEGIGCVLPLHAQYFDNCVYPRMSTHFGTVAFQPKMLMVPSVFLDGFGMSSIGQVEYNDTQYFKCTNGLHIPTFLLNNLESDCPKGEDENIPPENFTCPGFYRCQYSGNCLHPDFVCDGVPHCPNKDDEKYCFLNPPSNCTCEGFACSCHHMPSPLSDIWYLRYLDLSGIKQPLINELTVLDLLQFLNASFCELNKVTLTNMPQLKVLDLSYNSLSALSSVVIKHLAGLTHLNLSGNALLTDMDASFSDFIIQADLINIQHLTMADIGLQQIEDHSFSSLPHLVSLDIRSNSLEEYDSYIFGGLRSLKVLYTDDSRLCCSYFHTKSLECYAPTDELSSCNDLLRLDVFRVFLWSFSLLTILGNCSVLIYRCIVTKPSKITSYHVLVCHLCVSDLLMGVYMMMVGVADAHFRGNYVAHETQWRQSKTCLAAGFLGFVSNEVSAFMISLITLDRFFKLCYPFRPNLHLDAASYMKLGCLAWAVALLLAAGPLMGQLEFYGESSLCLPLPITRHQFSGQAYAFVVFIVLNFLLFLFIGLGQMAIYYSLCKAKAAVKTKRQNEDSAVARRLFLVVFTDFCCWFPVGLMGLLAFCDLPIPGVVTVWVAVFVLPINSALNPFLYTLNTIRERWRRKNVKQNPKASCSCSTPATIS